MMPVAPARIVRQRSVRATYPISQSTIAGADSAILGGFTEPSDPDLENQYLEETILGYDREVAADLAVGVKGIYRSYGNVVEDFLCADDGTYCIGNPGEGIMREVFTLDYATTFPAPDPQREVALEAIRSAGRRQRRVRSGFGGGSVGRRARRSRPGSAH